VQRSIPKSILLVKNRAMGDAIMGLGTAQYLRKLFPDCKIIYAIPQWITPLFKQLETEVDEFFELNLKSLDDFLSCYQSLLDLRPDVVMELFQSGRTRKLFGLYSFLTGTPYYAHNHHKKSGPVLDQGQIKSNIQRDLDGAWTYFNGNHDLIPDFLEFCPTAEVKNIKREHKSLCFGIVATRQTKQWPIENYAHLAHLIQYAYPSLKIKIPISSSQDDQRIRQIFLAQNPPDNIEFIQVPLERLPRELNDCSHYIGNDTGIKHLAVAMDIQTLTLFGPEPPTEWHPYHPIKHPFFFREPLGCRTVNAHYCGLSKCGLMDCLTYFTPEMVFERLRELIGGTKAKVIQ
jgi:heptosyltransferase-2